METMQLFYENLAGAKEGMETGRATRHGSPQNEEEAAVDNLYLQCLAQFTQSSLEQLTVLKSLLGWRPWM